MQEWVLLLEQNCISWQVFYFLNYKTLSKRHLCDFTSVMGSEITKASQEQSEPRILLCILWFIAHIFQLSGPHWLWRSFFGQPALIKFFQSMPSIFHRNNFAFIFPWLSSILLNHVLTVTDAAGLNTPRNIHNQLSVHRRRGCVTFTGIQDPPGRIRAFLFFFL